MEVLPNVYHQSNSVQRRDAEELLKKFSRYIQWRDDGQDTILDIGSGPGDVTIDFIATLSPRGFKKVVGVDLSEEMVKHANFISPDSRISFQTWDMAGDVMSVLASHPEKFDHIFSLYTLHWHPDQRRIAENIYDLLNPNGDCLLVILASHSVFDVYRSLSKTEKWKNLMPDKNQVTPPFQYKNNCAAIYEGYLRAAGFKHFTVEVTSREFVYNSIAEIKRFVSAVNSSIKDMSPTERNDYFHDFMQTLVQLKLAKHVDDGTNLQCRAKYKLMTVYAQK